MDGIHDQYDIMAIKNATTKKHQEDQKQEHKG